MPKTLETNYNAVPYGNHGSVRIKLVHYDTLEGGKLYKGQMKLWAELFLSTSLRNLWRKNMKLLVLLFFCVCDYTPQCHGRHVAPHHI